MYMIFGVVLVRNDLNGCQGLTRENGAEFKRRKGSHQVHRKTGCDAYAEGLYETKKYSLIQGGHTEDLCLLTSSW